MMVVSAETGVLIWDGRRFIDEEGIMELVRDAYPLLANTLRLFTAQWDGTTVESIDGVTIEGD